MSKTLISILCGEDRWAWDNHTCTIAFKEDGTGELRCQVELDLLIAAEVEWKLQRVECFDEAVNIDSIDHSRKNSDPYLISQFNIEIILLKSCIPSLRSWMKPSYQINESLLVDDAFRSKIYTVRLEKGNFLCATDAMSKEDEFTPRFALRLIFDKSPYPPREEWREANGAPDALKMWEWKEFCSRKSPELKALANNYPWWGKCEVY